MSISKGFRDIIDDDIDFCDSIIRGHYADKISDYHERLQSKYNHIIPGFSDGLWNVTPYSDDSSRIANIQTMKEKLEVFLAGGYDPAEKEAPPVLPTTPTFALYNQNNNSNSISINVTFPEVKNKIENMSALSEHEIAEILKKISELEEIVNSSQRKGQKWEKAKGIIHWIADKGVDVGIALLPLLLKIQ